MSHILIERAYARGNCHHVVPLAVEHGVIVVVEGVDAVGGGNSLRCGPVRLCRAAFGGKLVAELRQEELAVHLVRRHRLVANHFEERRLKVGRKSLI